MFDRVQRMIIALVKAERERHTGRCGKTLSFDENRKVRVKAQKSGY